MMTERIKIRNEIKQWEIFGKICETSLMSCKLWPQKHKSPQGAQTSFSGVSVWLCSGKNVFEEVHTRTFRSIFSVIHI